MNWQAMLDLFHANDFHIWQTGGGCTSYGKNLPGGYSIQITAGEDSRHPTQDGPCTVGVYHESEAHELYEGAYVLVDTVAQAIDKAAKAAAIIAESPDTPSKVDDFIYQ